MITQNPLQDYLVGSGKIQFRITSTGNLKEITDNTNRIRINTYCGNNFEATISNFYLVITNNHQTSYTRLLGISSPSSFGVKDNQVLYQGSFKGIHYQVLLTVFDNYFTYQVSLDKTQGVKVKLFWGQDLSIVDIGAISANEAYVSQYIDHKVMEDNLGFTICSRQNQGVNHYFEVGSLNKTVGYSTDGFQFFGKDYKLDLVPKAIKEQRLENAIYQYEFAYPALETDYLDLSQDQEIIFYGAYLDQHEEAITKPKFRKLMLGLNLPKIDSKNFKMLPCSALLSFDQIYPYQPLNFDELKALYPTNWEYIEKEEELLSFFLDNKAHVVLPLKERLMERPSGNIIISLEKQNELFNLEKIFASTHYIFGVFNSQVVYGNTSFNKLLSNIRNPLNLQKITGQRIFIRLDGKYMLLAMPSVYEMGLNYAKWIYKIKDDYLIIQSMVATSNAKLQLKVESVKGIKYDLLVTHHLTMQQTESDEAINYEVSPDSIRFNFGEHSLAKLRYPEYSFLLKAKYDTLDIYENNLFVLGFNTNKLVLELEGLDNLQQLKDYALEEAEKAKYLAELSSLVNHLQITSTDPNINSFNYLCYWFTHDALIHYLSPHGLEQYNGAAWGTRDVCQGPFELFKTFNQKNEMKRIIKVVFAHQFKHNYLFPQWFMFDRYVNICDTSSHGDVIIWPLRMVALYIQATGDVKILDEIIPYLDIKTMNYQEEGKLLDHLKGAIQAIEADFIKDTYLSCYGGGDWDDTLQPAKPEYKSKMVSGWTPLLTYEVFNLLSQAVETSDSDFSKHLLDLASNIKADYQKYMIKDGVATGFLLFDDELKYIIHPSDQTTNLSYRLLPNIRGIMSGVFDAKQKEMALKIINEKLLHPDGVRLMDRPIKYHGGVKSYFQRAETASNFGREIGMQYCHAHIRYCEMLQKLGLKQEFYHELLKINPIVMKLVVPNAMPRQRNSYFSSSDAYFYNRYLVQENFSQIKLGQIGVKGGWRVYSSGSGIYLTNFMTGYFGIEIIGEHLTIRPNVISDASIKYFYLGQMITINYHLGEKQLLINKAQAHYDFKDHRFIILDQIKDGDVIDVFG